jgi:hypothetical protein
VSSEQKIAANRINAQLSTGPRTGGGKAKTALNAITHGLSGKQIVLPNESPEDFDDFRAGLLNELNPSGALEGTLAEKIIGDLWRLRRVPVMEAALHKRGHRMGVAEAGLEEADPSVIATWSLGMYADTFANLWRHEAALSRSWSRALHELQRLQAARAGERVPAPAIVDVDVSINGNEAVNPE